MIDQFDGPNKFLSNFYESPIAYGELMYPTVEHAFQAAKTNDSEEKRSIADAETPGKAKRLGQKCSLRADWSAVRLSIMEEMVRIKFKNSALREMLLKTGDAELVEGNNWGDVFWGIDLKTREGQNHLGKILMKIRKEIQ